MALKFGGCEILYSYGENKCYEKIGQNYTLPALSILERALRRSLKKKCVVPKLGWYGLEVGKHKTCRAPKHICEKIDFTNKLLYIW